MGGFDIDQHIKSCHLNEQLHFISFLFDFSIWITSLTRESLPLKTGNGQEKAFHCSST